MRVRTAIATGLRGACLVVVLATAPAAGGSGLPQQAGVVDLAAQANLRITGGGTAVASAGDVNGDGLADVVVEALGRGADVVFGRRSPGVVDFGSLGGAGFRIPSADGPIAAAGDVNGDGIGDLLIGVAGASYVVFGGPSLRAVDLAALGDGGFRIGGAEITAATSAGDVNGDGHADLIVGGGNAAYVVFGKSSSAPVDLTALGDGGFRIGGGAAVSAVAGAGDVNGDGLADVIVRAAPAVYVVFGRSFSAPVDLTALGAGGFRIAGAAADNSSGLFSVAGAGDVNGDGHADVVIGEGDVSGDGLPGAGRAYVVFGKSSTGAVDLASLGNSGFSIDGADENAGAGSSVAGVGDVNGDGLADVVVGAPGANGVSRTFSGAAYVVFGKASPAPIDLGMLGAGGFAAEGAATLDLAGTSVAGGGDVNGDGRPDVIVGAPSAAGKAGESYVLYGFGAPALGYDQLTATVGAPITPLSPMRLARTGEPSFAVVAGLPPGLTLDAATGTISGTPQAPQLRTVYAVTMNDLAGATTASVAIQIDATPLPPPTTTLLSLLLGGRRVERLLRQGAIRLTASCNEPCLLYALGTVRIAGARTVIRLRPERSALGPGTRSLRLGLSPAARRRLNHLLGPGKRGVATVTVRASDAAGHAARSTRTIAVRR